MNTLQTLDAFLRTAQLKSFTRAADSLGLSRASVSRLVTALEQQVGQQLLFRTTRRVELTDAGRRFLQQAQALSEAAEALFERTNAEAPLTGCLRMACSPGLATFFLGEAAEVFAEEHPQLAVDIRTVTETVDLVATATDLVFQVGLPVAEAEPLGNCRSLLCASPAYLQKAGEVKEPQELLHHALVVQPYPTVWTMASEDGRTCRIPAKGRLKFSDVSMALSAVRRGRGIGLLPDIAVVPLINSGLLQQLLPQWKTPTAVISARTAPGKIVNRAAEAFKAFVKARLNSRLQESAGGGDNETVACRFAEKNP